MLRQNVLSFQLLCWLSAGQSLPCRTASDLVAQMARAIMMIFKDKLIKTNTSRSLVLLPIISVQCACKTNQSSSKHSPSSSSFSATTGSTKLKPPACFADPQGEWNASPCSIQQAEDSQRNATEDLRKERAANTSRTMFPPSSLNIYNQYSFGILQANQ